MRLSKTYYIIKCDRDRSRGLDRSPSPRRLHSLNSLPHFSRARLSAAPFTTSTLRASSFYAFIYAPFIIFKVRLFLARRRAAVIYFLPPGLPATVCCCVPRFIFIFLLLIMELVFYFYFIITNLRVRVALFLC